MANELRDEARDVFGVGLPGARVNPDKRQIADRLFGAIDRLFAGITGQFGALTTAAVPDSPDRRYMTEAQRTQLAAGGSSAGYVYGSRTSLFADLSPVNGQRAEVIGDSANDGVYQKSGASGAGSWQKVTDLGIGSLSTRTTKLEADQPTGLYDGTYEIAWTDAAGRVAVGVGHDGYAKLMPISGDPEVYIRDGQARLWAPGGAERQITFDVAATPLSARFEGGAMTVVLRKGAVTTRDRQIAGNVAAVAAAVTDLVHVPSYGQSNSVGLSAGSVIHAAAIRAGRALMFNGGIRTLGGVQSLTTRPDLDPAQIRDLVSAREEAFGSAGETFSSELAYEMTEADRLAATFGVLVSGHGIGSASYPSLKKGTTYYENLLAAVRRGRFLAALANRGYEVPAVAWDQGEAHADAAAGAYKAFLLELQGDLEADLRALAGGSGALPLAYAQLSNWTTYGLTNSNVPQDQLEAMLSDPTRFALVGPKYQMAYAPDKTHLAAAGQVLLGALLGRAIAKRRAGQDARPLYCTGATRAGAVITLAMNVPVAPLVIDTSAVSNPGNNGVTWYQTGGTARTISSVAVSGSNVIVTLNGDPGAPASQRIGIAWDATANAAPGPTSGPRSNLRDSSPDVTSDGQAMRNWACHQIISVT